MLRSSLSRAAACSSDNSGVFIPDIKQKVKTMGDRHCDNLPLRVTAESARKFAKLCTCLTNPSKRGQNRYGKAAFLEVMILQMLPTIQKICIAIAVLGFETTIGVLSMTPPLFGIAKIFLIGAAVSLAACIIIWASSSDDTVILKAILGALAGLAVFAWNTSIVFNDQRERTACHAAEDSY
jgi:hypothetical protein